MSLLHRSFLIVLPAVAFAWCSYVPGQDGSGASGKPKAKAAAMRPPDQGYVAAAGAFRLTGKTGEGLYVRPRSDKMFKAKLAFYGYSDQIFWYRESGTSFFIGFSTRESGDYDYPVYWGHWDTNGIWHGHLLARARKVALAGPSDIAKAMGKLQGTTVRQNIESLSPQQLDSLKRGIAAMKALPVTDRRSWRYQANIHGTTDQGDDPLWNQCEHGTLQFLTWHRGYLYYFERILRELSGDSQLTLPYWDWSSQPSVPEPYRSPADATNPLYDDTRNINDGSAIPDSIVVTDLNTALSYPFFPTSGTFGFSPSLEASPHGTVHTTIGGNMGTIETSANDPVFWLHHCNIDRQWNRWLNMGQGRANISDPAYLNQTYSYADEQGQVVTRKVADIISSEALGYAYDDVPNPTADAIARALQFQKKEKETRKEKPMLLRVASTLEAKRPVGESKPLALAPVTEKLTVPAEHRATLKTAIAAAKPAGAPKILVQIEGLSTKAPPNYTYGVYLNLPENADAAQLAKHYVGSINFFGRSHARKPAADHSGMTFTETLDATRISSQLQKAGLWKEDAVNVTLRPLLPVAPKGKEASLRQRVAASAQRAAPAYKSIHLLVSQ
jgi:tyrosinase